MLIRLGFVTVLCLACGSSAHPTDAPQPSGNIDLDLSKAPLTDALAMLAGKAQINLFADPHLDDAGPVTITLHSARWEDALAKISSEHQLRVEKLDVRGGARPAFWISRQSSSPAPVTTFTGEVIIAQFDDAPIRGVVAALSKLAGTTIVVDDDVQANVTLHLRLPWDLALQHLAQKYELHVVRNDGEIRLRR